MVILGVDQDRGAEKPDGAPGWRCPAKPVKDFVRKGGEEEQTHGRMCVGNGLTANIGLGQVRGEHGEATELPLITSGDDVADVARFLKPGADTYAAADVVEYLLSGFPEHFSTPELPHVAR